jgi:hypothetical protein
MNLAGLLNKHLAQSTVDYVVSKAKSRNESEQSNTLLLKSKDESVMDSLAEVGIFWLSLTNKVIKYSLPVGDVKLDHDIRDVPISHFSYWESLNKNTNHYSNLEWLTRKENIQHAYDTGLAKALSGTENYGSKLSEEDIRYIRVNYKPYDREFGARGLGRKFNVSHSIISYVINNKTYKNVK